MKAGFTSLPQFSRINPATIVTQLDFILSKNRSQLSELLNSTEPIDWSFINRLDDLSDRLHHFWAPINHLHAVKQTKELSLAYNKCLPKLSIYLSELGQNKALYLAIKNLSNKNYPFNYAQYKCLHNELRDFHLNGVDLVPLKQKKYRSIKTQLTKLSNQFEENLLHATAAWSKQISDKTDLAGLPEHTIKRAEKVAKDKKIAGFLLTLDYPSYHSVLTHADNRKLRKSLYEAYITRASEVGPREFNNGPIILKILKLRYELSRLLGFKNYAEKSLATNKMANHSEDVIEFLESLLCFARVKAKQEWEELSNFARSYNQIERIEPWDILYYREKLCEKTFDICDNSIRCYFPLEKVLSGLFNLSQQLFGIHIQEITGLDVWDPHVRFFKISDQEQKLRGGFYLDLYSRPEKREGAWMDDYQSRRRLDHNKIQYPIVFLTCNFSSPIDPEQTVFLSHEEVLTLFHEFGHGLQHLLTIIDYLAVSGTNGIAWDAIELPSQFLEYFAWEEPVLKQISQHSESKQPLPGRLIQKMRAAKNFHSGLTLLKQLELSLFDFQLHIEFDPKKGYLQIQQLLDRLRARINITPVYPVNRFQNSFSHIFSGSYAAGYYSYLWAEVLSCDAFSKFLEDGIFNEQTGQAFLHTILEQGGAVDTLTLFEKFRGRPPKIQTFLQSLGMTNKHKSAL